MSMGLLIDENTPVVWRGPMINKSIQQFISQVNWGELDVLVVDLPPGTGDAQLTLGQTLVVDKVLIVTSPSITSTKVAIRAAAIWQKLSVPIAGVVENFSYYTLPDGRLDYPLGKDGGQIVAEKLGVPLLATLPIDPVMRELEEAGRSIDPNSPSARAYDELAQKL
jgi:ATP-binding protein involved in chromosome partitioning